MVCKCKAHPFPHRDTDKKCIEKQSDRWFDLTAELDLERILFDRHEANCINMDRSSNHGQE